MSSLFRIFSSMAVILSVVIGTLTACSAEPVIPGSTSVREGVDATLTVGDLTVDIAGDALSGSGTLTVKRGEVGDRSGWDIQLVDGATLAGEATLTFKRTLREGEPPPIVMYAGEDGDFYPADFPVELVEGGARVTTTHFSFWTPTWFQDLVDPITKTWNTIWSPSPSDAQLKCGDAAAVETAGYRARGPGVEDERAAWCTEMDANGRPQLQVKNQRDYPMLAESTPGLIIQNADTSFESTLGQLMTILGTGPTKPGNDLYAVFAKEAVVYQVADKSTQGVLMQANPSAYVGQVLRFAFDTTMMLPGWLGKSKTAESIQRAWDGVLCVEGFGKMAGSNPESSVAMMSYLGEALDTSMTCVSEVTKKLYPQDAFVVALAQGLAWVVKGANLVGGAGQAVSDMVSNVGNPYVVTVSAVAESDQPTLGTKTEVIRLDPWASVDTSGLAVSGNLDECSTDGFRSDRINCSASTYCFLSADGANALCGDDERTVTWRLFTVSNTQPLSSEEADQPSWYRLELADGSWCRFSTGAGPRPPEGFEAWSGSCGRPDVGNYDVLWYDRDVNSVFLGAGPNGFSTVAIGPEGTAPRLVEVQSAYY